MEEFAAKAREPFKTALAIVISYGIALAMDWDKPFWAAFSTGDLFEDDSNTWSLFEWGLFNYGRLR